MKVFSLPAPQPGRSLLASGLLLLWLLLPSVLSLAEVESEQSTKPSAERIAEIAENYPATMEEARGRARWMHEMMHGALQVMHRDFFTGDVTRSIPSKSLEDVFAEMARSWSVEMRWLGINATKSINHRPKDRFEEAAAAALKSGETEFESLENGNYRFVGAIRLQNECLKCHVPMRTSLEDRVAGFALTIPLKTN